MSEQDSFDPRQWGGKPNDSAKPALPDAWREVGAVQPEALPPVKPAAPRSYAWAAPASSIAILLAGAAASWAMRAPAQPAVVAVAPPAAAAPAAPGVATASRRIVLGSPADLREALVGAGLVAAEAQAAATAAVSMLGNAAGEIRAVLTLEIGPDGTHLARLEASHADGSGAVVSRGPDGAFAATKVVAELTKQIRVVSGELDAESFYSSAVTAGVTDTLIPEFINAFAFDFNLAAEVKAGDTFEVAYEQSVTPDGTPVGAPQLVFASLTTPEKSRQLYRFKPEGQDVGWYDGNGASIVRSFMRTPVDGARITSNFGMRFHPVLHYTRLHAGVDFGVPVGTPVYSAADGTVTGATPTGCGGNMAVVQHDNGWVTRYFHLSQYAPGLHAGQRVTQGFTLGLSGTTGTCTTGPHLHYELRIDGEPVDPMSVKTDAGRKALEGPLLAAFKQARDRIDVARAAKGR